MIARSRYEGIMGGKGTYEEPEVGEARVVKVDNRSVNVSQVLQQEDKQLRPSHNCGDLLHIVATLFLSVFYDVSIWIVHYHGIYSCHIKHSH